MDDLRQKLFPIFLKEAEKNLAALRRFLNHETLFEANAEELATAFRAAHTLKGTANLVQAESICKIARRLERILEKHYEAGTVPTPVEHEALKLAVDWLAPLVSALQGDLEEPTLFVAEALQALDLAEAFPGRTPLIELLDSQEQKRAPQLDDPFAGDPDLPIDEVASGTDKSDPFADDPEFGIAVDLVNGVHANDVDSEVAADPFGDDVDYTAAENFLSETAGIASDVATQTSEKLPYDPFAEDSFELDVEVGTVAVNDDGAEESEPELAESVAAEDPFAEDDYELDGATDSESESIEEAAVAVAEPEPTACAPIDDPFAEDDYQLDGAEVDEVEATDELLIEDVATESSGVAPIDDPFAEDDLALEFAAESEAAQSEKTGDGEAEPVSEVADDVDDVDDEPFAAQPHSVAKRAEEIAASLLLPDQEAAPRKDYTCCVFSIGGRDYYLPIKQMQEIADLPQLLPLPLAPPMVSGLVNLRGQVLPVINLSILNQHQQDEVRVQRRLVIAEHKGESLAFLADGVPYLAEEFNGEKIDMTEFLSLYRIRGNES